MRDARGVLLHGALAGGAAAAGLMFIAFWNMVRSSPNAGALVDGRFRPYQDDPAWHLFAIGGAVLLAGGGAAFGWAWRKLAGKPI
jgi:hypothetical protein